MAKQGTLAQTLITIVRALEALREPTLPMELTQREGSRIIPTLNFLLHRASGLQQIPLPGEEGLAHVEREAIRVMELEAQIEHIAKALGLPVGGGDRLPPGKSELGADLIPDTKIAARKVEQAIPCWSRARGVYDLIDEDRLMPWAKASQNWSKNTGGQPYGMCRVKAHPLIAGRGSTEDTDTDLTIFLWTPVDGNSIPLIGQPNIIDDQEVPYFEGEDGYFYIGMEHRDGHIDRTMKPWHHATDEPAGWELCDYEAATAPNMEGRLWVGYDADDSPDYSTIGQTGGNKTINITHTQHRHGYISCVSVCTASGAGLAVNWDDNYTDYATTPQHSNVDVRDPYYTGHWIMRIDNSVAW